MTPHITATTPPHKDGPRTGVLLIKGPESYKIKKKNLKASFDDIKNFNNAFQNYPHRVVGGPRDSVTLDSIRTALIDLGQKSNEIFIIVDMHGHSWTYGQNGRVNSYINRTTCALQSKTGSDGMADIILSSDMYTMIGDMMRHDPNLIGKKLTVAHTSCSGMSGLGDFAELPENTKVVVYADDAQGAWDFDAPLYEAFSLNPEFQHFCPQKGWQLTQDKIVRELLLNGNFTNKEDKYNRMKVVSITSATPDTLMSFDTIPIGRQGGYVVDCKPLATIFLNAFTQEQIDSALVNGQDDPFLSPVLVKETLDNLRTVKYLEALNGRQRGIMDYMIYKVADFYRDRLPRIAEYADDRGFISNFKDNFILNRQNVGQATNNWVVRPL